MLSKIGLGIAIVLTILVASGCSSEGVFENPDSIRVTTLEAIHGKRGHLVTMDISKDIDGMTKQAVLEIQDKEVTNATLYVVIKSGNTGIGGMIDLLKNATSVAIVPDLPENTKPWTRLLLTFGDGSGNPFAGYLKVTAPTGTEYLSLKGTVTQERIDWFLAEVAKPPKVLDTLPAQVVEISYFSDSALAMLLIDEAIAGDTVYSKVVFSKNVPVAFADDGYSQPSIMSEITSEVQRSVRFPIEFQYRMQQENIDLQSGEAKPHRGSKNTFICRYDVQTNDFGGQFRTYAGLHATAGNTLQIILFRYTDELPANTGETITSWQPDDFVGQVYTIDPHLKNSYRGTKVPAAGVTVTIAAGHRAGESTITDKNGQYRFLSVAEDKLHLRTERKHFEPKEVIVHRSHPTALSDGSLPDYRGDPQKEPGNILIGQVWPEEVRILLREVLLVHDLLYIKGEGRRGRTLR